MRKSGLTSREGSRGGPASHGTRCAPSTGSARRPVPLPVEDAESIASTVEAQAIPSRNSSSSAARHVCGKDGKRARRVVACARSVRRPPEASLRSPWHAPVHARLMLHMRRTGAMTVCAHGRCKGKGARESRLVWVLHAMGSGRGSGCVLLCNGLLRLCVSVDRDRSRVRPLPAYVSRALKMVDFRVSPAPFLGSP